MIPDIEGLLGTYLREHSDIAGLQARVAAQTPTNFTRPWVKITLLDAPDRSARTDHLIESMVQFDCYAGSTGGSVEASLLTRSVRAALLGMPFDALDGAVVSTPVFVGMIRRPDTDLEPARERYVLTALFSIHRAGGGS